MPRQLGYCTNVHSGVGLQQLRENLARYAVPIKQEFSPHETMGLGLWFSARSASAALADGDVDDLRDWLREQGLVPFTLNGFPYGDFHQAVVKHDVYQPTWAEPKRAEYTLQLVEILDRLLPVDMPGSISTLPLAWHQGPAEWEVTSRTAAEQLLRVARHLARLRQETGRVIRLCLEPEPGCMLQRSGDVVRFFEKFLWTGADATAAHSHLQVCHDVCHADVMFEEQSDVLKAYRSADIRIGKIQVSSAIRVAFDRLDRSQRALAFRQLSKFAEDRYLHQTVIRQADSREATLVADLPQALQSVQDSDHLNAEWRIHFHVPVYLPRLGLLDTSQAAVASCLRALDDDATVDHFEVETYAWDVLPPDLQTPSLTDGIARELIWTRALLTQGARGGF